MTAADSGSKTKTIITAEIAKLKVINPCRQRAAVEELPLRQIFEEVFCTVDAGRRW